MRRGVTLLEVLVAAVLLAIGVIGALEVIAHCAVAAGQLRDRGHAAVLARSKMEEIMKEPVLQVGSDRGEAETDPNYEWEANIEQSQHPSLYLVSIVARNKVTGYEVVLTALRRPDQETPPETGTGTSTGTETEPEDDGTGTGGGP